MCRPFTWGTQIEIEAVACLFQVPVYECVQSQDGKTYHWEVHHPRAQADHFRLPPIVEDDPVYSAVIPHHFELAYTKNCHYDFIVDKKSGELCTTPRDSSATLLHKFNLELHVNRTVNPMSHLSCSCISFVPF